jgi:predicted RNase H-like HicB family nuclease
MKKLTAKDNKEIYRLRSLFPSEVTVRVNRSQDGGYYSEVLSFPNCFTEADTFSELVEMINDAIKTYFEVPAKYISYMPTYIFPIEMAQHLDAFPVRKREDKLKLKLINREPAHKN